MVEPNLDRFSQGIKDAQEAKVVGKCDECDGEIYEGGSKLRITIVTYPGMSETYDLCGIDCVEAFIELEEVET